MEIHTQKTIEAVGVEGARTATRLFEAAYLAALQGGNSRPAETAATAVEQLSAYWLARMSEAGMSALVKAIRHCVIEIRNTRKTRESCAELVTVEASDREDGSTDLDIYPSANITLSGDEVKQLLSVLEALGERATWKSFDPFDDDYDHFELTIARKSVRGAA